MGCSKKYRIRLTCFVALMVLITGFLFGRANCQTLAEFTQQKQLQTEYKVNQIVALKAYSGLAKQGYEIAGLGWQMVRGIQDGEFSQHGDYFGSLSRVHPVVSEYPGAENIVLIYRQIRRELDWLQGFLNGSIRLEASEVSSVNRFCQEALRNADLIFQELEAVLISDHYERKDGERLAAVEELEGAMRGQFRGIRRYQEQVRVLERQRNYRLNELERLNQLYDVR